MADINKFFNEVKLPVDERLIDNFISKYMSITYKDMSNPNKEVAEELYRKIAYIDYAPKTKHNLKDRDKLLNEINIDFINAGKPFNPARYEGIKNPLGIQTGWVTFKSWDLLGTEKIESEDFDHRFYFGIPNDKAYDYVNVLYDKFKEDKVPFYFKCETFDLEQRVDKIVLYTSSKYLSKTIDVIDKVNSDRPDLYESLYNPSIIVGKYNNKIGYASEIRNKETSYTLFMCESFLKSIEKSLYKYKSNPSSKEMNMYDSKLKEYLNAGKDISKQTVRDRIFFNLLIKSSPNYRTELMNTFKSEINSNGFDPDNICLDKSIKEKLNINIEPKQEPVSYETNANVFGYSRPIKTLNKTYSSDEKGSVNMLLISLIIIFVIAFTLLIVSLL